MISRECFTNEWITAKSKEYGYPDTNIIEKVIRAFSLLDMLAASSCPFHFKGGSCLMLLLTDQPYRLSIDIDIICPPGTEIEAYLEKFQEYGFIKYESVRRLQRGTNIPKSHSKFFYDIAYIADSNRSGHILLDVLNEDCHYQETTRVPIVSPFIRMDGVAGSVLVPSVGDILGDKLTAFAPNTTGIPYFKGETDCSLEIIKQLYDVGRLFDKISDLKVTSQSFKRIAEVELSYRNMPSNPELIFEDIRQTALLMATRGKEGHGNIDMLISGVGRIKSFMFQSNYTLEKAITDASKAAYVATSIEVGNDIPVKYSGSPNDIADLVIPPILTSRLNKLKRSLPEAYFYWAHTGMLLQNRPQHI